MRALFLTTCLTCATANYALEVSEPEQELFKSVEIHSIEDQIATLNKPDFVIDLSAARDDLFELEARRKKLTLADGTAIDTFGYNKEAGVLIGSVKPVSYISVTGREQDQVLALFHNDNNEVVAPDKTNIQLFDLNFNPIEFEYTPAHPPANLNLDVSIMIDVSGSMQDALPSVTSATQDFMNALPDFTRCSLFTFGSDVQRLTDETASNLKSCPETSYLLASGLQVRGATALHLAIKQSLELNATLPSELPKLSVVITDGFDTENPEITTEMLKALKEKSNSQILIFWAGVYNPSYLQGLADIETVSGQNVIGDLDRFLRSIGISLNGLQSIRIK